MSRKRRTETDRSRLLVAQEAARIIVNHGVRDYWLAKQKAQERLGLNVRAAMPGNEEVEAAVADHLQLFGGESHTDRLRELRKAAIAAMKRLAVFNPRLVGPVLTGTADENSAINLHVFTDHTESVAVALAEHSIVCRPYERRLKHRRDQSDSYAGFEFEQDGHTVQATVFPVDGIRQAPISPIDGKPMIRVDAKALQELLEEA